MLLPARYRRTDNDDSLVFEEPAITGGAIRDARPVNSIRQDFQMDRVGARSNDQNIGFIFTVIRSDLKRTLRKIDSVGEVKSSQRQNVQPASEIIHPTVVHHTSGKPG